MATHEAIIFCNCSYYDLVEKDSKTRLLKAMTERGIAFEAVPDLCKLAAEKNPRLKRWAGYEKVAVIACYPRAVRWLFYAGGADTRNTSLRVLNLRTEGTDAILERLTRHGNTAPTGEKPDIDGKEGWIPWFPVIDYDRCAGCLQCLNFCLFGVYSPGPNEGVKVENPSACKTNCPACARICPQSAIIFPKHNESPVNGDEPGEGSNQAGNAQQINYSELLKGDVYELLRKRHMGILKPNQGNSNSTEKEVAN